MKNNNYIPVIVCFGIFILSIGQLISQQRNLPHERVTLVTDRDLYISGETIWFTASCFLEKTNEPSPLSQILYIELIDANQKVFVQEKFKLENGRVSGFLHIPEELPTAYYFIRAYTIYLRNFPPESYYKKPVGIINPEYPEKKNVKEGKLKIYIQNDNIVKGQYNEIGFYIPPTEFDNFLYASIVAEGRKDTTQRYIYKEDIDHFLFIPNDSTNYKLYFIQKNLDTIEYSFPHIDTNSFNVSTGISSKFDNYGIQGNIKVPTDSVKITIRSQEFSILYQKKFELERFKGFKIDEGILSRGLNYIELRADNDSLLNLKVVYVRSNPIWAIIRIKGTSFLPREKVSFKIDTEHFNYEKIEFIQVSVVKKGTVRERSKYIPNIYKSNPGLLYNIDYQFFTKGLQLMYSENLKSTYDNVINKCETSINYIPEIRDVTLSGLVRDKYTKLPVAQLPVFASVLHNDFQFHHTETDSDGRFAINLPNLEGKYDMFLGTNVDTSSEVEILLNNDFSNEFTGLNDCQLSIDTSSRQLLEEMYINLQVSNSFTNSNEIKPQPIVKIQDWFGNGLNVIEMKDYISLTSIQEVFNEIVPSVRLREKDNQYNLQVYDDQSDIYYEDPLVLLDGIPVTDITILLELHPVKIDRIEVLNRTYILGNLTIRGLVSIWTKTDNFGGVKLPEDVIFVNYQTRTASAEFYPGNIQMDASIQHPLPWFKTLLYFNSFYSIADASKEISFYTSDHLSEYEIIVSGKTTDGQWIIGKSEFKVVEK